MKNYQIIIAVIFSLVAASSCNQWLELKPYDGVVEENYWQTKEDVHAVVIGCYSSLLNNDLMRRLIYWGELRADIMTPGNAKEEEMNVMRGEINPDISIVDWGRLYATINQCNKVIEQSANVRVLDKTFSETLYRQYLAEVTTIRSLMYFYLVRSFQNVPLVLKATDSDDQNFYVPNSEGAAILDTLVRHLEVAKEHVPINYGNNDKNKGRITRWSAMALLADIYLWQGNYAACRDLCTQIIGSGQFTLIPVEREQVEVIDENTGENAGYVHHVNIADADYLFDQLFVTGNCIESIFELQFPKTHETLGNPFDDLFYPFSGRPRMMANTEVLDGTIFPQYEGDDREVFDIRGNNFSYKSGTGYVWKFLGTGRGSTMRGSREFPHWIVYRLPDIMLMKAEALNQIALQSDNNQQMMSEAYDLTVQIRNRSNAVETPDTKLTVPMNGKTLERLILNERAREFAFEGKRWFDVLRFARRDNYANRFYLMEMAINSTTPDKVASLQTKYNNNWFHYWPIGTSAINTNPNLTQNDFYSQFK